MSRAVSWRRTCSDAARCRLDEASAATIYILREMGPTGFLLKQESEQKISKVLIGNRHSCTCTTFSKENGSELCKHICWVLLKRFRLSSSDPMSWQLGLCEREISELLKTSRGRRHDNDSATTRTVQSKSTESREAASKIVEQKVISEDDTCPICQEDLLDEGHEITYCRSGSFIMIEERFGMGNKWRCNMKIGLSQKWI